MGGGDPNTKRGLSAEKAAHLMMENALNIFWDSPNYPIGPWSASVWEGGGQLCALGLVFAKPIAMQMDGPMSRGNVFKIY